MIRKLRIDNIEPTYRSLCLVAYDSILNPDGSVRIDLEVDRKAFLPGQLDQVAEFITRNSIEINVDFILNILSVLWTEDIITQYNLLLAENDQP